MNYDRLRVMREIVAGIPEDRLRLERWIQVAGTVNVPDVPDPNTCCTIACAGGWICLDPRGKAMGISITKTGDIYVPSLDTDPETIGFLALAYVLQDTRGAAWELFKPRERVDAYDMPIVYADSDKQAWLDRCDAVLATEGT